MTLPLIYTLNQSGSSDKKFIINTVKSYSDDKKRVEQVIKMVMEAGGLVYARDKMQHFQNQAFSFIEDLPASAYKTSLIQLVRFTTERNH